MKIRRWISEHEVLVDFLVHIPWMVWRTFLNILGIIREDIKSSPAFRVVKKIFEVLVCCLTMLFLLGVAGGLLFLANFTDPKSKLRRSMSKYLRLAVEFLKLGRDALKVFGVLAVGAFLISLVLAIDLIVDGRISL